MLTSWKRALSELRVAGYLDLIDSACSVCDGALRYDQDVTVRRCYHFEVLVISLAHTLCMQTLDRTEH